MKIYFAASITAGREHIDLYQAIAAKLRTYGIILTEHVADPNLSAQGEDLGATEVYDRDMKWIEEADVLVADVSKPSLGVGYEIAKAEELGIPILCLFFDQGKILSRIISGNKKIMLARYTTADEATSAIDVFFATLN